MGRKKGKSRKAEDTQDQDNQEVATIPERRRSGRNKEGEQQPIDDAVERKKGRPKKSDEHSEEAEDAAAAAVADTTGSSPTPGEQSVAAKVKRGPGRPKKSKPGGQSSNPLLLEQSLPGDEQPEREPDIIDDEEPQERLEGDKEKRKRGRPKKQQYDVEEIGAVPLDESPPLPAQEEQPLQGLVEPLDIFAQLEQIEEQVGEALKRKRGRPKKPKDDAEGFGTVFLEESPSYLLEEEQPVQESPSLPPEDEQPVHGTEEQLDTFDEVEQKEEQPVGDVKKRKRGRPKKPKDEAREFGFVFPEESPALPLEEEQPLHESPPILLLEEQPVNESPSLLLVEEQPVDKSPSLLPEDEQRVRGTEKRLETFVEVEQKEEQPVGDVKKRKRGRPKKPKDDAREFGIEFLNESPSFPLEEQPAHESLSFLLEEEQPAHESLSFLLEEQAVHRSPSLPPEDEQPVNRTEEQLDTFVEVEQPQQQQEQPVDDAKKRKRGRPKKQRDDGKELGATSLKESPPLPPEDEQADDNSVSHLMKGIGEYSEGNGKKLAAIIAGDDRGIQIAPEPTVDDIGIQTSPEPQPAAISESKRPRGRPKKALSGRQEGGQEQQPIKGSKQKRKRGKLDEEELDQAEEKGTPPLVPGDDSAAVKLNLSNGSAITSDPSDQNEEEGVDAKDSLPNSTAEQNTEEQPKRKRGRPKKTEKQFNPANGKASQGTPPDTEQLTEEKQIQENREREESRTAEQKQEAMNGIESAPSSAKQPVEVKPKRKRGRPKKIKTNIEIEETKPGGQQVSGGRRGRKRKPGPKPRPSAPKVVRKQFMPKMVMDGIEFHVGDDVYVKKSDADGPEPDIEVEECRVCKTTEDVTMLECDECLAGFHLKCLDPPLDAVPEGDWYCLYCEKGEAPPKPASSSLGRHRTARERLLACDLWAARIERIWRETDGSSWFTAHWFLVPDETALGRQSHNGKRELFRSNRTDDNEMDSILRRCYVMSPKDFKNATGAGDDVFFCEYDYNEQWCKFKRIEYLDENENWSEGDQPFDPSDESEEDGNADESDGQERRRALPGKSLQSSKAIKAANKRHNYSKGIEEVGAKSIPDDVRKKPQTEFDRAKTALALSAVPPSLPCRDSERKEISSFLSEAVGAGEQCLGRCLYISGVPGTGKTATVLEVIKELGSKVESGELPPYRFVEINGLRLPSPEHAYTILHEALTGQHVGWKRALQYLDERFSKAEPGKGVDARPTVLLVDELDLLVTRNQSVLYNIFDWPTRLQSRLVIIGIANTMDLPERMLPRIVSRMGMHRISFSPYTHKQLEEIISARLDGIPVFDKQAAEFASRKVAAVSGDIRRALELCRRAVEVAEARLKLQSSPVLGAAPNAASTANGVASVSEGQQGPQDSSGSIILADVDAAISEMFEAPQIQMMKRSAKLAKIFLVAMVHEQRRTSMAETTFDKIATTCSKLCASNGEEQPDWDILLSIGCKLGASRLLLCEPGAQHRLQKLQLNFPCDDVSFALKKDEDCPWLVKYL